MADNVVGGDFDPLSPKVTSGAEAALAGGDDAAAERARYYRAQREQIERLSGREEELYAKKEAEEAPLRRDLEKQIRTTAQQSELATNRLMTTQRDLPEFNPDNARGDAFQWMSLAAGFGAIAGAFSRYHTTTALNAFAGMTTGFAKGQLQVFDQKYKEWEANTERAREYNQRALREYNAIMNNAKLNLDAKSNLMQLTADKWQDQIMANAAQLRDVTRMTQLMDAQGRFDENMQLRKSEIQRHKSQWDQAFQMRVDQIYGGSQDVEGIKQQILSLATQPPSPALQARYPYLRRAMDAVMKENPHYQAADFYANQQVKKLAASADVTAMRAALTKATGMETQLASFEPVAEYNGNVLLALVDKVDQTGTQTVFEAWLRAGRKATGDPDVAQFDSSLDLYTKEVARITTNPNLAGVLSDSARHESQNLLPENVTPANIRRVIPALNGEMKYRHANINAQIEYLTGSINSIGSGGPRPTFQAPEPPPLIPEPLVIQGGGTPEYQIEPQ